MPDRHREFEDGRNDTAPMLAAFALLTWLVSGIYRPSQRSAESVNLLRLLDTLVLPDQVLDLILDPVRLHRSAEGCRSPPRASRSSILVRDPDD